jgi:hypothetical protein
MYKKFSMKRKYTRLFRSHLQNKRDEMMRIGVAAYHSGFELKAHWKKKKRFDKRAAIRSEKADISSQN